MFPNERGAICRTWYNARDSYFRHGASAHFLGSRLLWSDASQQRIVSVEQTCLIYILHTCRNNFITLLQEKAFYEDHHTWAMDLQHRYDAYDYLADHHTWQAHLFWRPPLHRIINNHRRSSFEIRSPCFYSCSNHRFHRPCSERLGDQHFIVAFADHRPAARGRLEIYYRLFSHLPLGWHDAHRDMPRQRALQRWTSAVQPSNNTKNQTDAPRLFFRQEFTLRVSRASAGARGIDTVSKDRDNRNPNLS